MSLTTDLIKMMYSDEGYLPGYPYHLISDKEMYEAFISDDGYFFNNYPLLSTKSDIKLAYETLVDTIKYYINQAIKSNDDKYILPDWIYSYMLGKVISVNSNYRDIHDLIKPLLADNIDDVFTAYAQEQCYKASRIWIQKLDYNYLVDSNGVKILDRNGNQLTDRPITMFGEPHIIKYIRLYVNDPVIN